MDRIEFKALASADYDKFEADRLTVNEVKEKIEQNITRAQRDTNEFEPAETILNSYPDIKASQRLRILEMCYRMSKMDLYARRRFLEEYDRLCSSMDTNEFEPAETILNSYPDIKASQRLKILEICYRMSKMDLEARRRFLEDYYRMSKMDLEARRRFLEDYDRLCSSFATSQVPTPTISQEFLGFVRDRCVLDKEAAIGATALYEAFREYCSDKDIPCASQRMFGAAAGGRFHRVKLRGIVTYRGVRLKTEGR